MKGLFLLLAMATLASCYQLSDEGHISSIPTTNNSTIIQDSRRNPFLQPTGY